jgi:hypothetical protein
MLYQGLRSHIPSSRLWREIKTWEQASIELVRKTQELRKKIDRGVREQTDSWPEVLTEGFVGSLGDAVLMTAEGRRPDMLEYRSEESGGTFQLLCGGFILARGVSSQQRLVEVRQVHQKLLQGVATWELVAAVQELMGRWQSARDSIQEEVAVLRLRQVLPGQCRLCPGTETPSGRHSSKDRRGNE